MQHPRQAGRQSSRGRGLSRRAAACAGLLFISAGGCGDTISLGQLEKRAPALRRLIPSKNQLKGHTLAGIRLLAARGELPPGVAPREVLLKHALDRLMLVSWRPAGEQRAGLVLRVYEFPAPRYAYALYTALFKPEGALEGVDAFRDQGRVVWWRGRLLLSLAETGLAVAPAQPGKELLGLLRVIDARQCSSSAASLRGGRPLVAAMLPVYERIPHSERFYISRTLGGEPVRDVAEARFTGGVRVLLILAPGPKTAQRCLAAFKKEAAAKGGAQAVAPAGLKLAPQESFSPWITANSVSAAFRAEFARGREQHRVLVGAVLGAPSMKAAVATFEEVRLRLLGIDS